MPDAARPSEDAPALADYARNPAAGSDHAPAAEQRRGRFRAALYDLLVETFAVVLGITVALFASDWQADRADRARAAQVRTSIVEEVRANRAAVAEASAYHGALMDSLRPLMAPGAPSPPIRLFARGFVSPARTLTTAWDAATATDAIALLDYGEVLTFSRLYAAQQNYGQASGESGRIIYAELFEKGFGGVVANYRNLASLISSAHYLEQGLLAEYDETLRAVGADSTAAAPSARR